MPRVGIKADDLERIVDTYIRWEFLSRVELHHWNDAAPTQAGRTYKPSRQS